MYNFKIFIIVLVFLIFLLLVLFLLFLKRRKQLRKEVPKEKSYLNPFNTNPLTRNNIKRIQKHREHKKKERFLEELFLEFETEAENDFQKLRKIAHKYRKNKHLLQNVSYEEKKSFEKLEDFIQNMKSWEQKKKKIAHKDAKQIIDELKQLGKVK